MRQVSSGNATQDELDVIGLECDVSSEQSVQKAYNEIINRWGRIDSVVASAGEQATVFVSYKYNVVLRILRHRGEFFRS